ncbi:MAG: hypothetical protein WC312_05925 [Candidatus Omnitrophota bacterium]|jgi:2-polyprenyl-3-methyl-5-hydroxy-6-metoxy-1,4-benzoquinol methylase
MRNIFKKRNPIKFIRKKIREYFFFKDKRTLFKVNLGESVYDDAIFKNRNKAAYIEYGEAVEKIFSPPNLIDIGCANAYLLEYFHNKGMQKIAGIEGAETAFKYMPPAVKEKVLKADLSKEKNVLNNIRFYLVNCTEVGEHIPCKYEDIFLKNIQQFVGNYLILSWANTWEEWLGFDRQQHVNPRSKRYVIKKLKNLGLRYNRNITAGLIKELRSKPNVFRHWIKNIMVFENRG